jgi:hypothetical protein
VQGVANASDRRGILLKVKRASGKERRVLADQLWAKAKRSADAVILDDYREWVSTLEL